MSTKHTPHAQDMGRMIDIHDRLTTKIERLVPMNRSDVDAVNDAVIPFQDEAYECGRKRGALECNAELLEAAMTYAMRYVQDEAADDACEWMGCSQQQHEDAKALFAAIAKATGEQR